MKLIKTLIAASFMGAVAVPAGAEMIRTDGGGVNYVATENPNGIVMQGNNGSTLYLGKDCDAFHTAYGAGAWGWANGGFWANLANRNLVFGRQEVPGFFDASPNHCRG